MRRCLCLAVLSAVPALARGTGTIHGTVTDPTGLAIPHAKVTATLVERSTARRVGADAQGGYVLPLLPVGTYTIAVEAAEFKQFTQQSVTLTANQHARVDARLEVGALN